MAVRPHVKIGVVTRFCVCIIMAVGIAGLVSSARVSLPISLDPLQTLVANEPTSDGMKERPFSEILGRSAHPSHSQTQKDIKVERQRKAVAAYQSARATEAAQVTAAAAYSQKPALPRTAEGRAPPSSSLGSSVVHGLTQSEMKEMDAAEHRRLIRSGKKWHPPRGLGVIPVVPRGIQVVNHPVMSDYN